MLTIGWFSTGRGEGSRQLLQVAIKYIQSGEINGKIIFVFSNREPNESTETDLFFELVEGYHIPLICFSSKNFKATKRENAIDISQYRLNYDREVMKRLQDFKPDICVLAGYMLIVGDEMCSKYKMVNLHPALPDGPTGSWRDVIWNLIENEAEESGIMMHLATPELDRGPVITYCRYPIKGGAFDKHWQEVKGLSVAAIKKEQGENNTLFKLIRQHGLARELPLIMLTLKSLSTNEIRIKEGKLLNNQGKPIAGYDLSHEVDRTAGMI